MQPWKLVGTLILALASLSGVGCSSLIRSSLDEAQAVLVEKGRAIIEQAKAKGAEILAQAEAKAAAVAEVKYRAFIERQYAGFDAVLAQVGPADPVTGATRTWKDFDLDKSGELEPGELAKMQGHVALETSKRVLSGTMTKEEAIGLNGDMAKGAVPVAAAWAAMEALRRRRKGQPDKPPAPAPAAPPPPDPKPAAA